MLRVWISLTVSIWLCLLSGCITPQEECAPVYAEQMEPVITKVGFTIDRPENPLWFYNKEESFENYLLLRKRLYFEPHTFYAKAALYELDCAEMTQDEFMHYLENNHFVGIKVLVYEKELTPCKFKGFDAISFEIKCRDYQSPLAKKYDLYLYNKGFIMMHPYIKGFALEFYYSERGTKKQIGETKMMEKEGEAFLQGVSITK